MNSNHRPTINRWGAAARHLVATLALTATCLGLLFWLWYSPGLWGLTGIPRALWILLAGAIVAGPLMTLAAYRPNKPGLRTDMTVIIVIQLAFLAFAAFGFARNRPVYLVAVGDRFELVRAGELAAEDLAAAKPEYRRLSWTGPRVVGVDLPLGNDERFELIMLGLGGKDIHLLPRLYTTYEASAPAIVSRSLSLAELAGSDARAKHAIEAALSATGRTTADTAYVPIRGPNYLAATMLIDAQTGQPVRPVNVDPWKNEAAPTN